MAIQSNKRQMKKLLLLSMLFIATSLMAQQNCGVVCHNGTLLTGVNERAVQGHITHGDTFITTDCNYVETGNECESLGVPKFTFKTIVEDGLEYYVYDISGKIRERGETTSRLYESLPRHQMLFLKIEGYQTYKFIK